MRIYRVYTGSGQSPTSSLRDDRLCVPHLNALKFLQWGARKEEEMKGHMLGEGLPEEKLQESYYNGE
jgi:hypothetical protein